MSNNGAWSGDHSEQLEEMFKAIVDSEKASGKNITVMEKINIRHEIAEAYDELINCFSKEKADSSVITYAVNLMKSTVSNTNDLRDIGKLALAISESTIGALYLVNHLENKREEKGLDNQDIEFLEENEELSVESLTEVIDCSLDPEIMSNLCSDENEQAYDILRKKALAGDKNAIIAIDIIRKSINYMHADPKGKGRDLAALSLVDKLISTGEEAALTSAEQVIDFFGLEKYDIYSQDENGKFVIDVDKVRKEFAKGAEKIKCKVKPEDVEGLKRENKFFDENRKKIYESLKPKSMSEVIKISEEQQGTREITRKATILSRGYMDSVVSEAYMGVKETYTQTADAQRYLEILAKNNPNLIRKAIQFNLDYYNTNFDRMKNPNQFYTVIANMSEAYKRGMISEDRIKFDGALPDYLPSIKEPPITEIRSDEPFNEGETKETPDDDDGR